MEKKFQAKALLEVSMCLSSVRDLSHSLNQQHIILIDFIFNHIDLSIEDKSWEKVILTLFDLILHLVSGQNDTFINQITSLLVGKLRSLNSEVLVEQRQKMEGTFQPDEQRIKKEVTIYSRVLPLIKEVMTLAPSSLKVFVKALDSNFPHLARHTLSDHKAYLKNILSLARMIPYLREDVLFLCTSKLIILDSNIEIDEIDEDEDDLLFSPDEDTRDKSQMREYAEKLDNMMEIMFAYIDEMISIGDESFFGILLRVFNDKVLPTVKSKFTQFLVFYLCAHNPRNAEFFINYLLNRLMDTSTQTFLRQASAAYLGSFISRACYLSKDIVKSALTALVSWTHTYLDKIGDRGMPDAEVHSIFYSVSQAIFYIVCFHSTILFTGADGQLYFNSLNFDRIVVSRLNPLKFCLPAVVQEFANITSSLGMRLCSEILKKNESLIMATRSNNGNSNTLETFFPFDPYVLRISSRHVEKYYREWSTSTGSIDDDDNSSLADDASENQSFTGTPADASSMEVKNMSFTPTTRFDLEFHFQNSVEI